MKQISRGSSGFECAAKRACKQIFPEEMERVMPWAERVALIEPHASKSGPRGVH